jgi:hypothetical protein
MSRVGQVAQTQAHFAVQVAQSQHDNALLTGLVDTYVKVRELIQDQRFFEAMISSGYGIILYKQFYPRIVGADSKLKAADLEMKLINTIREIVTSPTIGAQVHDSYVSLIAEFRHNLKVAIEKMKNTKYQLVWLKDPDTDIELEIGDEIVPIKELLNKETNKIMFVKGKLYKVEALDNRYQGGFVIRNEQGQLILYHMGDGGLAESFALLEPQLPREDTTLTAWSLIERFFSEDFLKQSLKSCSQRIEGIRQSAFQAAGATEAQLRPLVDEFRALRERVAKDKNRMAEVVALSQKRSPLENAFYAAVIVLILCFVIYLIVETLAR